MTRLTIMGASIVLLLAAFMLTPAEAYPSAISGRIKPTHTARPRTSSFSISPAVAPGTSKPIPRGGPPAIAPKTAR
jgi:hypothetical protein